ncbi:MAG: T9SS type A sorting domain-containing protein [Saprospiraceae bacterium]|nr:T9SS type A sorting domain-containing protein [Saprospiraceae bacterium]
MKLEKFTSELKADFSRILKISLLPALMALWVTSLNAQCPLACNNLVQVSLDEDCDVEITPDMMLEGQGLPANCTYLVQVIGANGQPIGTSPRVTSLNIGQTLQVKVWLTINGVSFNHCWGSIKVEDKLVPTIDCPAPITISCYSNMTFTNPPASDNCGSPVTIELLSDITTELPCTDQFRAVRNIRYQAKDGSGNLSAICTRVVYYSAISLTDVKFPKNYDSSPGHRPHLECDGTWPWGPFVLNASGVPAPINNWDTNGNGYPDPAETGGPYIIDPSNITGFVTGYQVGTPNNPGVPVGCTAGNLVGSDVAILTWRNTCDNNSGIFPFRIDTFYRHFTGNNALCKINTTFSDTKIDICPKSFKVLRHWTVLDWCTGTIAQRYQIIKVVDSKGPVATIPSDITEPVEPCANDFFVSSIINADPYACTGEWLALEPINVFDCNEVTYTVSFLLADGFGNPPQNGLYVFSKGGTTSTEITIGGKKRWILRGLPLGCTWIKYTLTDACGNSTEAFTEIRVVDRTPPVAVCDQFTVVTLNANGWAHVFAESFDDGSHDNCTPVTFGVRRRTSGCQSNGAASLISNPFGPFVQVCCDDIGREVMVELEVTDDFGNKNTCMVIANAQDKVRPVILCPANITINCGQDTSVTVTGLAEFSDNCPPATLTRRTTGSVNSCGVGSFSRTFTVTDRGGLNSSCTQTITVRNPNPYNGPSWVTVGHRDLEGCLAVDTDPSKTGVPTLNSAACSLVAYTYEDQVFPFVEGVCYKILRKWTVIDWCKFRDDNDPSTFQWPSVPTLNINMWQYTQIIKINDNVKPVLQVCTKAPTDAFGENCTGFVELVNSATDCTPSNLLKWTYQIDPNNDGLPPFINGTTNNASGTYPVGTHRITWTVEDQCGNLSSCNYTFVVRDRKKPTPYCISEVTTVIMPSSGNVAIWAIDFDLGSFDNCPGDLRFSFSTNVNDTGKTFTCSNLGINTVNMYVWDVAGNFDFCTVTVNIQDNGGCAGSRIAGSIGNEELEMVEDVQVTLQNMVSNETMSMMTTSTGHFEFAGMPENSPYSVTPVKNTDHLNGVSTMDLVLMQRHILGVQKLNTPYKVIAADVNKDSKVTANDLVELRKLILGIYNELPNNQSWRFIDKAINFPDIQAPWTFSEYVSVNNLTSSLMHNDFVAVKVGDLNLSAKTSNVNGNLENRSKNSLKLVVQDEAFKTGETVKVNVKADNFKDIVGTQFTLNFDATSMEFVNITGGALAIKSDNVNVNQAQNGRLAISWNQNAGLTLNADQNLFTIEFRATTNNTISRILSISSDITKSEAYTNLLEEMNLEMEFRTQNSNLTFELLQNNPNPFTDQTIIGFVLPEQAIAKLTIYDVTGKVVSSLSSTYPKGNNEVIINADELNASGVLFYELESNGSKAIRKMINIKK